MSPSRSAILAVAAALAACGGKPEPTPKGTPPAIPDSGTTGAKMRPDTTIPVEAYRLAAGPDGLWAWAAVRGGAFVSDGAGWNEAVAGSAPAGAVAFSADGKTLFAGLATVDLASKQARTAIGAAQLGAGLSGKAAQSYASGYEVRGNAWAPGGDLVIVSEGWRPPRRESSPPPDGFPTQRTLAFDATGALVAEMGKTAHPLIAVGADRVFATGGLTIETWKRSDLARSEKIPAQAGIAALVLSRDETRLAYAWNDGIRGDASAKGAVVLWDVAGAKETGTWRADTWVADAVWSPDGTMIATAGDEGAKLWKLDGASATAVAGAGLAQPATAVAFTPDGKELLVALGGAAPKIVRVSL